MYKFLITILFFLFFAKFSSAQSANWVKYYTSYWSDRDHTPSTEYYYDSESIKYSGGKIYFFEMQTTVNGVSRNASGRELSYTVIRFEVNCNTYTFRGLSMIDYFIDGGEESDYEESQTYTASPDSKMYEFINKFCK